MNLTIALCEAAKPDNSGTISALGLGATRLWVKEFPGGFAGTLLMFFTSDKASTAEELTVQIKSPASADWTPIGGGVLEVTRTDWQIVGAIPVAFPLAAPGIYVLKLSVQGASAELRIDATLQVKVKE